ncbi:MAG: transglutaminase-like domain-containing protein [Actinomycetota bacterium]
MGGEGDGRLVDGLAFVGDRQHYYDPANSLLPSVLDRRRGIPISLSVLTMGVARRVSVPVDGVAMPGHFLLRDRVDPTLFVDAFNGGVVLDERGCGERLKEIQGPDARLDPDWLEPVPPTAILVRMLTNLRLIHRQTGDRAALGAVLELLTVLPHGDDVVAERAELLAAQGRFDLAADLHEQLDDGSRAQALRARLN